MQIKEVNEKNIRKIEFVKSTLIYLIPCFIFCYVLYI